jgi:hypothetical protein
MRSKISPVLLIAVLGIAGCDKAQSPAQIETEAAAEASSGQEAEQDADERADRLDEAAAESAAEARHDPGDAKTLASDARQDVDAAAAVRQQGQQQAETDDADAISEDGKIKQ